MTEAATPPDEAAATAAGSDMREKRQKFLRIFVIALITIAAIWGIWYLDRKSVV